MSLPNKLNFLCIGSATQDVYLLNTDGLAPVCTNPEECFFDIKLGEKIYVNKVNFNTGGGASNAATTFARGGQDSAFMGLIGCDPAASAVISSFTREHINTKYISYTNKYNTDYSTMLLAPNGERTILTYRGCGMHIAVDNFNLDKVEKTPDWIYMTSLVGHYDIYNDIVRKANDRGIKIAFNPGARELDQPNNLKDILKYVTILSVNKQEAQKIVSGDTLSELLLKLRQYCPVVIITDGVNGSIAGDDSQIVRAGLYKDQEVLTDRTGAGDAFASGFTLRYALGDPINKSVHYASANSSSVVNKIGSKTGILRLGSEASLEPMNITSLPRLD